MKLTREIAQEIYYELTSKYGRISWSNLAKHFAELGYESFPGKSYTWQAIRYLVLSRSDYVSMKRRQNELNTIIVDSPNWKNARDFYVKNLNGIVVPSNELNAKVVERKFVAGMDLPYNLAALASGIFVIVKTVNLYARVIASDDQIDDTCTLRLTKIKQFI